MLGSGIFVLPGLAASMTGPSIWLAYLVAAFCVLPAALSKAELATAMPTSGGTYVYVERAFGPWAGTIAGVGLWFSLVLKSSFSLVGLSAYLSVIINVPLQVSALVILTAIVFLNIAGVKRVGKTQQIIMSFVFLSMLIVILPAFTVVNSDAYWPFLGDGYAGFFTAVAFVFVSYTGVTEISAVAEEVKDPDKSLPRAILISLSVVAVLYALVSFALVGVLPFEELVKDIHPIYTLASVIGGVPLGYFIAIIGVVTLASMANTGLLTSSRFPFAMSRDQLFPSFFCSLHPQFLTPVWSVLFTGGVMVICILCLDVMHIAKLASAFKVLMFIFANASTIVFRETGVQWYSPKYRSAFYPWMQIFGIVSGIFLIFLLGLEGLAAIGAMVLGGSAFFFLYGKKRVHRKSVLRLYGRRALALFLGGRKVLGKKSYQDDTGELAERSSGVLRHFQGGPIRFESLMKKAAVVVPLYGKEHSPETLAEIGSALAEGEKVEVVHIKEFPYQTSLDAVLDEDLLIQSLTRRIKAMAEDKAVDVEFDAVVTHDLVSTVHNISNRSHCKWLVMGWRGREASSLLVSNPIGWLITHLSCNLALFKDAGVRYIRRILVHARQDENCDLVTETADSLASIYKAQLTFIRVATPEMSEATKQEQLEFMEALQARCNNPSSIILAESDNRISGVVEESAAHDLLVFGAAQEKHFVDVMFGRNTDRLTEEAPCSVLRLATPAKGN